MVRRSLIVSLKFMVRMFSLLKSRRRRWNLLKFLVSIKSVSVSMIICLTGSCRKRI